MIWYGWGEVDENSGLTGGIFVMLRKYRLGCVLGLHGAVRRLCFPVQAAQIGELQFEHAKGKLKNSLMLAKMSVDGHERRFFGYFTKRI